MKDCHRKIAARGRLAPRIALDQLSAVAGLLAAALCLATPSGAETAEPVAESLAVPLFTDHTDAAGLDFVHRHGGTGERLLPETMGGGGCVFDLDGDGALDLYLVQSGSLAGPEPDRGERDRVYRNRGDGTFADVTATSGAAGGYGMGAVCGDLDGDGDDDVFVTTLGRDRLLRNDGGELVEFFLGDEAWSTSATLFDAEGDGDLDLYVVRYLEWSLATRRPCRYADGEALYCHPDVYPAAADVLWRNRGRDGAPSGPANAADLADRFEDATSAAGLRPADGAGKGLGVVATDIDDDGDIDLYVANDSTPNFLWSNQASSRLERRAKRQPESQRPHPPATPRFEDIGLFAGVAYNGEGATEAGMGVDAGDVDGDGRMDLFVTHLSLESNTLYRQRGDAGAGSEPGLPSFDDATRRAGLHAPSFQSLGFGTHLVDFDEDGDLDLLVANGELHPNVARTSDSLTYRQAGQAFRNLGGPGARIGFEALSAAEYGAPSTPRVARGSLLIDIDDDGARDLLVLHSNDRVRLYRRRPPQSTWLGLSLDGPADGVGARVTVEPVAKPGLSVARRQVVETRRGSSYLTSSDPRLVFGLGGAERAQVTIRWLDGTVQRETLGAGRYHRVVYRAATPSP